MSDSRLDKRHRQWKRKPALRAVYEDVYSRIAAETLPGVTLEIGGGSGNFKEARAGVVSIDLLSAPWLDAAADAQALPFVASSFDNIVMFDVLHHVERPVAFFEEAQRVLRDGGRIVLVEPDMTPLSRFFYAHFHPEPIAFEEDPLAEGPKSRDRDAFDANQAIPTLLFRRRHSAFMSRFPTLRMLKLRRLSLFAYPLSGGFRPWSLIPSGMVRSVVKLEDALMPILGPLMAFRMLVVLEHREER